MPTSTTTVVCPASLFGRLYAGIQYMRLQIGITTCDVLFMSNTGFLSLLIIIGIHNNLKTFEMEDKRYSLFAFCHSLLEEGFLLVVYDLTY